jgi:hypothetical protein
LILAKGCIYQKSDEINVILNIIKFKKNNFDIYTLQNPPKIHVYQNLKKKPLPHQEHMSKKGQNKHAKISTTKTTTPAAATTAAAAAATTTKTTTAAATATTISTLTFVVA